MVYYFYKINFKNGDRTEIYLKDITNDDLVNYINTNESKLYNNRIINWAEVQSIKCHELNDKKLTKIVNGNEKTMKADNE